MPDETAFNDTISRPEPGVVNTENKELLKAPELFHTFTEAVLEISSEGVMLRIGPIANTLPRREVKKTINPAILQSQWEHVQQALRTDEPGVYALASKESPVTLSGGVLWLLAAADGQYAVMPWRDITAPGRSNMLTPTLGGFSQDFPSLADTLAAEGAEVVFLRGQTLLVPQDTEQMPGWDQVISGTAHGTENPPVQFSDVEVVPLTLIQPNKPIDFSDAEGGAMSSLILSCEPDTGSLHLFRAATLEVPYPLSDLHIQDTERIPGLKFAYEINGERLESSERAVVAVELTTGRVNYFIDGQRYEAQSLTELFPDKHYNAYFNEAGIACLEAIRRPKSAA